MIVWLIVVKGQYKSVEKVFLAASFFYITYIFAGFFAKPAWIDALVATVKPPPKEAFFLPGYLYMAIGVVGTTIAPWMQFYLQSSIVEKGVTRRQYKASQMGRYFGMHLHGYRGMVHYRGLRGDALRPRYHNIADATDAAQALSPLAGKYAYILFAIGLFNASLFAASILPLSTAYTVCEGLGFESGRGQEVRGSAGLLLAVHGPDYCRSGSDSGPKPSAGKDRNPVAGGEWHCDSSGAGLYVVAGEQERADGGVR